MTATDTLRTALAAAAALLLAGANDPPPRPAKVIEVVPLPAPDTAPGPARDTGWTLVWSDEFDGPAIDRSKWDFNVDCWGGGNNERQCYTDSPRNAAVADGKLVITARKERHTGPAWPPHMKPSMPDPDAQATREFTSARMVTKGHAAWRYGRIEVRAKLPQGQGTWPAIWMLPEGEAYGPWASSGEIDILEAVNLGVRCKTCPGGRENTILGTLHFGGRWPNNALNSTETHAPDVTEGFHTFGIVWEPGRVRWTYDGQVYADKRQELWWSEASATPGAPFDQPFHLILNLAIGGGLAEERGRGGVDKSGFPKQMEVDWVRVWQCRPENGSEPACKGG